MWSHILGKCMRGDLIEKKLNVIPSVITDFESWKESYPDSTVSSFHVLTLSYSSKYYTDRFDQFVIGMTHLTEARGWTYDQLAEMPVVNDHWTGKDIVVFFDSKSGSALIFNRTVEDQVLEFELVDDQVVDRQTNSIWDINTGRATFGPLKDTLLTAEVGIVSFTKTWKVFHPDSEYWQAPSESN